MYVVCVPATLRTQVHQRLKYIGVASLTALVWDHIDTFVDEVEYIWKGRKGVCKSKMLNFMMSAKILCQSYTSSYLYAQL